MYNFNGSGAVCRQQRRFLSEALEGAPGEARGGGSSRLIRRTGPGLPNLHLVVSVDGPQPEHDRRRAPATYDRVMRHIAGHSVIIHCNVTRQMTAPTGYLTEFSRTWSGRPEVRKIWFSLYTPQDGDQSAERLKPEDRVRVVYEIAKLRKSHPKVEAPDAVMRGYPRPPSRPEECIFAQTTACISADLATPVTPCQFGGRPVCVECGCMASAGLAAIGRARLAGLISVSSIFSASRRLGEASDCEKRCKPGIGSCEFPVRRPSDTGCIDGQIGSAVIQFRSVDFSASSCHCATSAV